MTEHQDQAHRLEDQADRLEQRNEALDEGIAEARDKAERLREDDRLPGPPSGESGLAPEANYTTSGDQPPEGPGDDE